MKSFSQVLRFIIECAIFINALGYKIVGLLLVE